MNSKSSTIFYLLLLLAFFTICYLLPKQTYSSNSDNSSEITTETIQLPKHYFAQDSIHQVYKNDSQFKVTEEIQVSSEPYSPVKALYDNEIHSLPPMQTAEEAIPENGFNIDQKNESYRKFGDIALRFMAPEVGDYVSNIEQFDLDNDGEQEQIATVVHVGASTPEIDTLIIKDSNIVFSAGNNQPSIVHAENHNGFYLISKNERKWESGYYKTRFIFSDGLYQPVVEQEILHVTVN